METLISKASRIFEIEERDLKSGRQLRHIAHARQAIMYAAHKMRPALSYATIGEYFRRDHTTAMFAVKAVERRMARDQRFAQQVAELMGESPAPAAAGAGEVNRLSSLLERRDSRVAGFLAECQV